MGKVASFWALDVTGLTSVVKLQGILPHEDDTLGSIEERSLWIVTSTGKEPLLDLKFSQTGRP